MRVRITKDGMYFIPRRDAATEAELDASMDRIGNELMWRPRVKVDHYAFTALKPRFTKVCYIVGKGASIDAIDAETLDKDNVILAINDAGAVLESMGYEPLTIIQDLFEGFKLPIHTPLLVRDSAAYKFGAMPNSYIYSKQALGVPNNRATSVYAVALAAIMGCEKAIMLGFDSITTGSLAYSHKAANSANRGNRNHVILIQKELLAAMAEEKGIVLEYITAIEDLASNCVFESKTQESKTTESETQTKTKSKKTKSKTQDSSSSTVDVDSLEEVESDILPEPDQPCIEHHACTPSESDSTCSCIAKPDHPSDTES